MDNYTVIARSMKTGNRFELFNIATTPTRVYQAAMLVGPNTATKDEEETFELFVNGATTGTYATIRILCKNTLMDLAIKINSIIDSIWWYTFHNDTAPTIVHFNPETATFEDIMKATVELDNAYGWHTFDKIERINNLITYEEIVILIDNMSKLSLVKFIDAGLDQVSLQPIIPGQIIFTRDGKLFWDVPEGGNGKRIPMVRDIIEVHTKNEFDEIQRSDNIIDGFYFVIETGDLYRYNNYNETGWQHIGATLANSFKDGLMSKGLYKKLSGLVIDSKEPNEDSKDTHVTTAARLWKMIGAPLSSLKTTAKTIIDAINELYERNSGLSDAKIGSPEKSESGKFLLSPNEKGGVAGTVRTTEYMKSPAAQTDRTKRMVLIAPEKKGDPPILLPLSSFAYTAGGANVVVANDDGSILKADHQNVECIGEGLAGNSDSYARADHSHPLNVLPPDYDGYPLREDGYDHDAGDGKAGRSHHYARADHSHPINISKDPEKDVRAIGDPFIDDEGNEEKFLGASNNYSRADHTHPFGDIGNAVLGNIDSTAARSKITKDDTLKKALKKLQNRIDFEEDTQSSTDEQIEQMQSDINANSKGLELQNNTFVLHCTKGQQLITLTPGTYDVECYGAQGGGCFSNISDNGHVGGLGGVAKARFVIPSGNPKTLYCYVGEQPNGAKGGFPQAGSCKGGGYYGNNGYGGGGCSFISTEPLPDQYNTLLLDQEFASIVKSDSGSAYSNTFTIGKCNQNGTIEFELELPYDDDLYTPMTNWCTKIYIVKNGNIVMNIFANGDYKSDTSDGAYLDGSDENPWIIKSKDGEYTCEWIPSTSVRPITDPKDSDYYYQHTHTYIEANGSSSNYNYNAYHVKFSGPSNTDDIWGVMVSINSGHGTSYKTANGEFLSGYAFAVTLRDSDNIAPIGKEIFSNTAPLICAGGGGGASKLAPGNLANITSGLLTNNGPGEDSPDTGNGQYGAGGSGYRGGIAGTAPAIGGKGGSNYVSSVTINGIQVINGDVNQLSRHYGDGMIKITKIS